MTMQQQPTAKVSIWHGPLWIALMTATLCLSLLQWNRYYEYCHMLGAALNLFTIALLTGALFRQALLPEEGEENRSGSIRSSSKETEMVSTKSSNANNRKRHPTYLTPSNHPSQQENRQRLQDYSHIQANKWNQFHIMKDQHPQNDHPNEAQEDGTDDNHPENTDTPTTSIFVSLASNDNNYHQRDLLHLAGCCSCCNLIALPYTLMAGGTGAAAILVFLESLTHDNYYLSYNQLTSLVDWFRTLFLLSFGALAGAVVVYELATVILVLKRLQWGAAWVVRRVRGPAVPELQEALQEDKATEGEEADGTLTQPETQQEEAPADSLESNQESEQSNQSTTLRPSNQQPEQQSPLPYRTSQDVLKSTPWAAALLAAVGFCLGIVFCLQRQDYLQDIEPAMRWRGQNLDSFQGDVWVLGAAVDRTRQQGRSGWCTQSNGRGTVPVTLDVAWGGAWACPQHDEGLMCQATIESQVPCTLATEPLPYESDYVYEDEDANDDNAQGDDNANDGQGDDNNNQRRLNEQQVEEEELYFPTVHDYINYRYHYPIADFVDNNDDDNYNFDDVFNNFESTYYTTYNQAPDDLTQEGPSSQDVTWNRPAEFVLANCDNCEARSLDTIQEQFPHMIAALHGLFTSWGVMGFGLFWMLFHKVAKQTKRQRETTGLVTTQLPAAIGGDFI